MWQSQIDLLIRYIMPFLQIRLNSMRYIRRTFFSQFTSHSGSLSATLKRTSKFFPKQFFSPPLFYISMPVPWHKILRDKFHIYAIHPLFRNNFFALVAGYKYLRKPGVCEHRKELRCPAEFTDLMFTSGCLAPALQHWRDSWGSGGK